MKNKIYEIETLRGLACILLVFLHLIGAPETTGLRIQSSSYYYYFNEIMSLIRMPLFAFLGGFVLALRPPKTEDLTKFIKGKFKRLYIPLIFVGIPFVYLQANSGVSNQVVETDGLYYFSILWKSQFHFWFLQAMLLVFMFFALLSRLNLLEPMNVVMVLLGSIAFLAMTDVSWDLFSVSGAVYLLPYTLLGFVFSTHYSWLKERRINILLLLLLPVSLLFYMKAKSVLSGEDWSKSSYLSISSSILSLAFVLLLGFKSKFLSFIGEYSFAIFLYHVYGLVAARVFGKYLGLDIQLMVILGLVAGIFFPILLSRCVSLNGYASLLLLGQSKSK